jgi:hypothetical protein
MRKLAKITRAVVGTFVAIVVISGVANACGATAASAPATTTTTTTPTTSAAPSATPAPTSAAPVALTADDLFVADVLDTPGLTSTVPFNELVGVGRSICGSIGVPGVNHASLVGGLGTSRWGPAVAEAVVSAAERNLCPERRYVVPTVTVPTVAPAPPAPAARPEPKPQPAMQPAPEESSSSAYYKNCTAARAAGAAPLHRGEPGYRAGLDRDGDGVACE